MSFLFTGVSCAIVFVPASCKFLYVADTLPFEMIMAA